MNRNVPQSTSSAIDKTGPQTIPGFEAWTALNSPLFDAMTKINGRMLEQAAAVTGSWAEFMRHRLEQDLTLPQKIAKCQSVQEFFRVYSEFMQEAFQEYQQEFAEIVRMNQSFGNEAAELVRSKSEEAGRRLNA